MTLRLPSVGRGTVKGHVANIHRKLQARNRVEIAIWAYENSYA